jgi:hypothetical protein
VKKTLSLLINIVVIAFVSAEIVLILMGHITADQLLVSSGASGLLILLSIRLIRDALSHMFILSEEQKEILKSEIDILDRINSHIRWKTRLRKYIEGSKEEVFDPEIVARDDHCTLGKWLHGPALKYFNGHEGVRMLRESHAQFHMAAAKLVRCVHANDLHTADKLFQNDIKVSSHNVLVALTRLDDFVTKNR